MHCLLENSCEPAAADALRTLVMEAGARFPRRYCRQGVRRVPDAGHLGGAGGLHRLPGTRCHG
jgi:hypothetical protein